jgi:hypothetical protein
MSRYALKETKRSKVRHRARRASLLLQTYPHMDVRESEAEQELLHHRSLRRRDEDVLAAAQAGPMGSAETRGKCDRTR